MTPAPLSPWLQQYQAERRAQEDCPACPRAQAAATTPWLASYTEWANQPERKQP